MYFRNVAMAAQQSSGTNASVTTHVMQVLLQLPNGITMPVNIPAAITPQSVTPIGKSQPVLMHHPALMTHMTAT